MPTFVLDGFHCELAEGWELERQGTVLLVFGDRGQSLLLRTTPIDKSALVDPTQAARAEALETAYKASQRLANASLAQPGYEVVHPISEVNVGDRMGRACEARARTPDGVHFVLIATGGSTLLFAAFEGRADDVPIYEAFRDALRFTGAATTLCTGGC